jgi:hypothetical protein
MAIMENEKAIWLTGDGRVNEIIDRLRDYRDSDLLYLYREANGYSGGFEFADTFDVSDLTCIFDNTNDLVHAIINGNVSNIVDEVRFDRFGNLESVTEETLYKDCEDYVEELAEWLMDNYCHVDGLYTEDEELFNKWQEIDSAAIKKNSVSLRLEGVTMKFTMDMTYSYKGSLCHTVTLEQHTETGNITIVTNYGEVVAVCASGNQVAEVLKDLSDGKYA